MPNELRARDKINLEITMAGLSRVHDRYLRGSHSAVVLGDELTKDLRWLGELERILLGNGYLTQEEIRKRYQRVNQHWRPEYDKDSDAADFKR